jgi:hypothetical protein
VGVFTIYLAAERATGSLIYDYGTDYKSLARRSYAWLDFAAIAYGFGLVGIAAAALLKLL